MPTQEALPGALVPEFAVNAAAAAICDHNRDKPCDSCIATAAAALTAGLAAIDPEFANAEHVLICGEREWVIQHPLSCRPNLGDCPMTAVATDLDLYGSMPANPGRYTLAEVGGETYINGVRATEFEG
jgi:hypothetical protein